ncbi:DNA-3-methyladenine glycosylase [Chitinophagaceae bacterium 26-R-25]|nr:DNA-3-methyladenine glycosylase [Chitinophagaceae bacterium 26-R-25]
MQKLDKAFYEREDVVKIAKQLIGKVLVTNFDGAITTGRIVETEAYNGAVDKASHAYNSRRTKRTEIMFGEGGKAYVYLCYGIHHLFNVVTNVKDVPHAVLIRAIEPLEGIETMLERMKKTKLDFSIGRGPGNVSKALGIATHHTGNTLFGKDIYIADDGFKTPTQNIIASPRIGVDYAAEDALLPYRFYVKDNGYVSGKKQ